MLNFTNYFSAPITIGVQFYFFDVLMLSKKNWKKAKKAVSKANAIA